MTIKKLPLAGGLVVLAALFAATEANAGWLTEESPIGKYGTATTVSISTSAWTKAPASSSLAGRSGILVSVPATNSANVVAHLGGCSSTALATTVRPLELFKGNGFALVPIENGTCLWFLSLHTSAESIHVQEVGQ